MTKQKTTNKEMKELRESVQRLSQQLVNGEVLEKETFMLKDQSLGREIELSSGRYDAHELANIALASWQSFWNGDKRSKPAGVG